MLNLGESILDVLAHKKYHQDIAAHVKLPYKKSWLKQKDPFVLARKTAAGSEK
jgi:nitrogenase molybdenum-iron protein alpha chain